MNALCTACLCSDRNLYLITEPDLTNIYDQILNELSAAQCPLRASVRVCWECRALLRRFQRFRAQVQSCYLQLLQHSQQELGTVLTARRPRLQRCSLPSTSWPEPAPAVKSEREEHREPPAEAYPLVPLDDKDHQVNSKKVKLKKNKSRKQKIEPPESEFSDGASEREGVAEQDGDSGSVAREFENAILVKENLHVTEAEVDVEGPRVPADGFNESDDEPLGLMKKEAKPRGRRKKKDAAGADEPNAKKTSTTARREKPAGVVNNSRVLRKLRQLNVSPDRLEMIVLGWDEVEEERQRALASAAYTRHEYRCHHCAVGFNHRCKLDEHMRKHDPSAGGAECSACTVRCRDAHALAAHRRRHRVRWRCRECGGTWSRAAVAADHAARAHGAAAPTHSCSVCGQLETTLAKLRNHMKNHSERQKCELCGKTFRDRTSLRTHLFIHRGEKEYSCVRCDKRFLFKRALEVHLVTHLASAHLYCHVCDKNFKNRMSYNQHMKYNLKHIDPAKLKYACDACDKKFAKATRLQEHKMAVHLKITPIQCTVPGCNFACSSRPVLRTHARMLHRDARARRNHVCHVCGKTYTTKKSLEGHLRTHSGERPFRCARCPAAFGYEATLYNHTRLVHLRNKPTHNGAVNLPSSTTEPPTVTVAPSLHPIWP